MTLATLLARLMTQLKHGVSGEVESLVLSREDAVELLVDLHSVLDRAGAAEAAVVWEVITEYLGK